MRSLFLYEARYFLSVAKQSGKYNLISVVFESIRGEFDKTSLNLTFFDALKCL